MERMAHTGGVLEHEVDDLPHGHTLCRHPVLVKTETSTRQHQWHRGLLKGHVIDLPRGHL